MKSFANGIVLALTLWTPATSAAPKCYRQVLAQVLSQADQDRPQQNWAEVVAYKNTPRANPRRVILDAPHLVEAHPAYRRPINLLDRLKGMRSRYEDTVLHLKKGDTVVFGEREFVLGDFLGAGNTTHIFSIAGTDRALRIPFIAEFLHEIAESAGETDRQFARFTRILDYSRGFAAAMKDASDAVTLIETGPSGRYQIVERIHGTQTGADLLKTILGPPDGDLAELPLLWTGNQFDKNPREIGPEELDRMNDLVEVMRRNGDATRLGAKYEFRRRATRQYLYDTEKKRWVLLDRDS